MSPLLSTQNTSFLTRLVTNLWRFFPYNYKQMLDTSWMSDSLVQPQRSLYGDSIRSHRLGLSPTRLHTAFLPTFQTPVTGSDYHLCF